MAMELAESYRIAGRYSEAHGAFADAHARLVALGREDTERAGTLLNNWSLVLGSLGRPLEQERMLRRVVAISRAGGSDARVEPIVWANLARTLFDLARYDEGIALATRAYREALARGDTIVADQALIVRARLLVAGGDPDRGAALLDEVEAHFMGMFTPAHVAFVAVAIDRIRVAEVRGNLDAAAALADRALAMAESDERRQAYLPQVLRRRAEVNVKRRRFGEARADAERAIALSFERIPAGGYAHDVGLGYLALGEALAGEGRTAEARSALASAADPLAASAGAEHPATRRARQLRAGS
jgi:tetratricopeptide (TPR) repeat protein